MLGEPGEKFHDMCFINAIVLHEILFAFLSLWFYLWIPTERDIHNKNINLYLISEVNGTIVNTLYTGVGNS